MTDRPPPVACPCGAPPGAVCKKLDCLMLAPPPPVADAEREAPLFRRASDADLVAAGFDPTWLAPMDDSGPFVPIKLFGLSCQCCGGTTSGWTVVNVETCIGHSTDWTHDEAETEAHEVAGMLNAAWKEGATNAEAALAQMTRERDEAHKIIVAVQDEAAQRTAALIARAETIIRERDTAVAEVARVRERVGALAAPSHARDITELRRELRAALAATSTPATPGEGGGR